MQLDNVVKHSKDFYIGLLWSLNYLDSQTTGLYALQDTVFYHSSGGGVN